MYEIAYITASSKKEAEVIARTLLERKLVACVNIHEVSSLYWWKDRVESAGEFALICKTTSGKREDIINLVKEKHSYENPCVVFTEIRGGSEDYLNWVKENTTGVKAP